MCLGKWLNRKIQNGAWPELWTTVTVVDRSHHSPDHINRLAHHLARGADKPLHLIVSGKKMDPEVRSLIFQEHGHRIHSITIPKALGKAATAIPADILLPALKAMWLPDGHNQEWLGPQPNAPNLTKLVQPSGRPRFSYLGGVYRLEDIQLYGEAIGAACSTARTVFEELYKVRHSLKRLHAALHTTQDKAFISATVQASAGPEGFSFPVLEHLQVWGFSKQAAQLLARASMPNLRTIEVLCTGPDSNRTRLPTLRQVEVLHWRVGYPEALYPGVLGPVLEAFPCLQEVFIHCYPDLFPDKSKGDDSQLAPFLPNAEGVLPVPELRVVQVLSGTLRGIKDLVERRRTKLEALSVRVVHASEAEIEELRQFMGGITLTFDYLKG